MDRTVKLTIAIVVAGIVALFVYTSRAESADFLHGKTPSELFMSTSAQPVGESACGSDRVLILIGQTDTAEQVFIAVVARAEEAPTLFVVKVGPAVGAFALKPGPTTWEPWEVVRSFDDTTFVDGPLCAVIDHARGLTGTREVI